MARASVKATPSRPRKETSARPKKAAPANRGYGEKGVAKYDPGKHPRGADGRFLSKGGKTEKAPKTPRTRKTTAKSPAKPKKVGTAKQRKGLADQIRAARAAAKTPEAKKALLTQVRGLRQKRSEWKRGQGKKQVEPLPKAPKEKKPKAEPKPKEPKKSATKPAAKSKLVPDLRSHYESIKHLPEAQKQQALKDYLEKHQTPAAAVQVHGMAKPEEMHSIPLDGYNLHYPKGDTDLVIRTTRGLDLYKPFPTELTRHTKDIYLTRQANSHDEYLGKKTNRLGSTFIATGGGGSVVFYGGRGVPATVLSHEMGHNLAAAKYGRNEPGEFSEFRRAMQGEKPPTEYGGANGSEDFAESVMMYTRNNATFKKNNPRRYKVIDRLMKDANYVG